jgi:hypothetical protein
MRVFLKQPGQSAIYNNGWATASAPIAPSGGMTVDVEARDAIAGLIDTLRTAGILILA